MSISLIIDNARFYRKLNEHIPVAETICRTEDFTKVVATSAVIARNTTDYTYLF